MFEDPEHREYIFSLFGVLPGHGAESGLEDVYMAQTVWDETMADTSAHWLGPAGQGAQVLLFAGVVHCQCLGNSAADQPSHGARPVGGSGDFASTLPDPLEPASLPDGYDLLVVLED